MPTTLQFRRGSTSELATVTGEVGELFVDTTKDTVVVHDGSTQGGFPLQRELVSGTNIRTINNTSLLSSGNISLQSTLVSGSNIKTINGNSILGSGDITISGGTGGTTYDQSLNTTNNVRFNNLIIGSDSAPTTFRFFESNNLSDRINLANADNAQDGGVVQRSPIGAITGGDGPTSTLIPILTAARLNGYVSYIEIICTAAYLESAEVIITRGFKIRGYAIKIANNLIFSQIGTTETLFNINTSGGSLNTQWLTIALNNNPTTNTIELLVDNSNTIPGTKWVWGGEVTVISAVTSPAVESGGEGGEGGEGDGNGGPGGDGGGSGGD
jgi:hypothetical protein